MHRPQPIPELPVAKARHAHVGDQLAQCPSGAKWCGIVGGEPHERDDVGNSNPRVDADVGRQINPLDCNRDRVGESVHQPSRQPHTGEHRTVVIRVGMDVEHPSRPLDRCGDRLDGVAVGTHGKVRYSFDQTIHRRKVPQNGDIKGTFRATCATIFLSIMGIRIDKGKPTVRWARKARGLGDPLRRLGCRNRDCSPARPHAKGTSCEPASSHPTQRGED